MMILVKKAQNIILTLILTSLINGCSTGQVSNFFDKVPSGKQSMSEYMKETKEKDKIMDKDLNLSSNDYTKYLSKSEAANQEFANNIESLPNFISEPDAPKITNDPPVSLSISNDMDVKEVLIELARIANLDLEIDPKVKGNIILKVTDKPLSEVIDRVTELSSLRYWIKNNTLHVELDTPYMNSYPVDFLSIIRNNKNSYKIKVGLEGSGSSSSSSIGSGSSTEISYSQDENFWDNIQKDITQMVNSTTYVAPNPTPYVSVNKQAGIINVVTNSRIHNNIKDYLRRVKRTISSQALIEAKIVEVNLSDEFKTGINWNMLDKGGVGRQGVNMDFTTPLGTFTSGTGGITLGVINGLGRSNKIASNSKIFSSSNLNELTTAVNLMEMFGRTRTLSSPRLHAMNNQQAVLSFAQNQVYFKLKIEQTDSTTTVNGVSNTAPKTNVTSELQTVPIGLVLTLQPSINSENNEIIMSIRPTISRIVGTKKDPSIVFALLNNDLASSPDLTSDVPIVEVKELDSVLKIKSGEIMVIGGMMEESFNANESGVPGIKDVFVAGNLFKSQGKIKSTIQTVIFIKATIIPSSGNYSENDKDFYNTFTNDPNPFRFNNKSEK